VFHVLQAVELLALQNTFQRELSESAPELIVLLIDHSEVGFHYGVFQERQLRCHRKTAST
jgi:hypothetical protein